MQHDAFYTRLLHSLPALGQHCQKLNDLIVDAGPSTYRLELKPDDICLLGWFAEEQLVVLPRDAAGQ